MQNTWVYQKIQYKRTSGFLTHVFLEPDEDQLKEALNQIVEAANKDGWTVTALTCLPHERVAGTVTGVTLVATLSKP